jgi:hypothetical protein
MSRLGSEIMRRLVTLLSLVALSLVAVILTVLQPVAAEAAPAVPSACPPDAGYVFSAVTTTAIARDTTYGSRGITITVTLSAGQSVTGTITGTVGVSVNYLIASAKADVSGSIAQSMTATYTTSGSYTIPASQSTGWVSVGAQARSMNWQYGAYTGACKWVVQHTGTAKLPTLMPYFFHS